ncbi:MAG: PBP1A family penicillin-binding protein [Myxococcota bacterium]
MAKKRKRKRGKRRRGPWGRRLRFGAVLLILVVAGLLVLHLLVLQHRLDQRLAGGATYTGPRFYTSRLVIVPGMSVAKSGLLTRIDRLEYRRDPALKSPGSWRRRSGSIDIHLRAFKDPDGALPARLARLHLSGDRVSRIADLRAGKERRQVTLEPLLLDVTWNGRWQARRPVRLADLPKHVPQAILAAEDARFYSHPGVDLIGVLRAMFVNLRAGEIRQGASTLTQQLAKNFFLTPERTWRRKAQEAVLAWMIESRLTKDEILSWYLNEVYLGRDGAANVIGVGQGAQTFFGKRAADLTVGEAATIAGIISSPNPNSPLRYPDRARKRRDRVLRQMADVGFISSGDAAAARKLAPGTRRGRRTALEAPFFLAQARREVAEAIGESSLQSERLDVYTTLDLATQASADRGVRRTIARLEKSHAWLNRKKEPLEAAFVVLDPRDGAVLALVGGRDYARRPFDHATQSHRQLGSTFKPFVYLAAFEGHPRGITASSPLEDKPLSIRSGGKIWQPANYDGHFHGTVTVRRALERSLNVPTVRLAQIAGLDDIIDTAAAAGWDGELPRVPALALGVAETSLIDLAGAYTVFPMQGTAAEPYLVRGVLDQDKALRYRHEPAAYQAADPRAAYIVHHLLEGVVDRGTARSLRRQGFTRPIAGKTGTTNDYRDAWFVGYTPTRVGAAWIGFDDGRPLRLPSSSTALNLWASAMGPILDARPVRAFSVPRGIVFRRVDPVSGLLPAPECPDTILEAFLDGTEPHLDCRRRSRTLSAGRTIEEPVREATRKLGGWFRRIFGSLGGKREAPAPRKPRQETRRKPPKEPERKAGSPAEDSLDRLRDAWNRGRSEREGRTAP